MRDGMHNPFVGPPPENVHLPRAPLVRVIAQIRFPTILKLKTELSLLAEIQEQLREDYPLFAEETIQTITVQPTGQPASQVQRVWRLSSGANDWRMSLSESFFSLEASKYSSRGDFVARLDKIIKCLETVVRPRVVLRTGVRFVSRMVEPELSSIEKLVKQRVIGISREDAFHEHADHVLTEATATVPEGKLLARWGHLPEGATFDPAVLEPHASPSWIFDIDVQSTEQGEFASNDLPKRLEKAAERCYSMFRWLIEDEFLRAYGGKI